MFEVGFGEKLDAEVINNEKELGGFRDDSEEPGSVECLKISALFKQFHYCVKRDLTVLR